MFEDQLTLVEIKKSKETETNYRKMSSDVENDSDEFLEYDLWEGQFSLLSNNSKAAKNAKNQRRLERTNTIDIENLIDEFEANQKRMNSDGNNNEFDAVKCLARQFSGLGEQTVVSVPSSPRSPRPFAVPRLTRLDSAVPMDSQRSEELVEEVLTHIDCAVLLFIHIY